MSIADERVRLSTRRETEVLFPSIVLRCDSNIEFDWQEIVERQCSRGGGCIDIEDSSGTHDPLDAGGDGGHEDSATDDVSPGPPPGGQTSTARVCRYTVSVTKALHLYGPFFSVFLFGITPLQPVLNNSFHLWFSLHPAAAAAASYAPHPPCNCLHRCCRIS